MKIKCTTKYMDNQELLVQFARYDANNTIAIQLIDADDGSPWMKATVCIPGTEKEEVIDIEKTVFIKNWSENEGIYEALIENEVIEETVGGVQLPNGLMALLCPLSKKSLEAIEDLPR